VKFILSEVHRRDESLLRSRPSHRKLLGKLERGPPIARTLFPQAQGRTLNVVVSNAPFLDNCPILGKLSEKKTAFALDPGVFLLRHIPILEAISGV